MPKRLLLLTMIAAAWPVIGPLPSHAQGRGAAADPVEKVVQLKPDLYYVPGGGANAVIRVTPEGLIFIDTKNPGRGLAFLQGHPQGELAVNQLPERTQALRARRKISRSRPHAGHVG